MSDICPQCGIELELITEEHPCDDCTYIHDDAPSVFEELDFNKERRQEYEPDFAEVYDKVHIDEEETVDK